jgi:hypothetical protein
MMDPFTSLAFSVYSGKGVYALLLGSGISRASGMPTGWEIVLDLVRKSASLEGLDCGDAPASWYESHYGKEPDYVELLESVGNTSAERAQLLRAYFEPNDDEREQGKKAPTSAHKAIARLVADGYIRVIITTNFDRLLEQALERVGVMPTVVSSADSLLGAMPLAHNHCTVIKVHGDYLDTRLKNTAAEIGKYDETTNRLLDQIFDQYGLIICGWSADWDVAMRNAITRCPTRRFTTFWSAYSSLKGAAKDLSNLRAAQVIEGQDADTFFQKLLEKVTSLAEMDAPHPLSKQMAVATIKRYLTDPRDRIRLQDLLTLEAKKVCARLGEEAFSFRAPLRSHADTAARMPAYEASIDSLLAMLVVGVYHGEKRHRALWLQCLERVSRHVENLDGNQQWARFGLYPVFLLMYGCGIAAVAAGRYATLVSLLTRGRSIVGGWEKSLWYHVAHVDSFALYESARGSSNSNARVPAFKISQHIYDYLRPTLADYCVSDSDYLRKFRRFEYLATLVFADLYEKENPNSSLWIPLGRFVESYKTLFSEVQGEIDHQGDRWPLLRAGAFDRSLERLQSVKAKVDKWASELAVHHGFW